MLPSSDGRIDDDVATAIELTVLCQDLHVLPNAGGLLDQDSYHVWLMQTVMRAQNEKAELDKQRNSKPSAPSGRVTQSRHR